jgi:hypothetical protein
MAVKIHLSEWQRLIARPRTSQKGDVQSRRKAMAELRDVQQNLPLL